MYNRVRAISPGEGLLNLSTRNGKFRKARLESGKRAKGQRVAWEAGNDRKGEISS